MSKGISFEQKDGSGLRIGVAVARWNGAITRSLREGCERALLESGVRQEDIVVQEAPGSFELPLAAKRLMETDAPDAVVALGCLIKGDTMHFECIALAVSQGLMRIQLETGIPVIFGVLACLTEAQAIARSAGDNNHGYSWGKTAIEMAFYKK